ncbi:hypothetical protein [Amycolatopsis sp. NPDC059657]|uniref:hypothetical protein n=1 Tax=Amycolatopsis sp. NPDC059657 TaxID=3346899 RepID=UPI00366FEAA9
MAEPSLTGPGGWLLILAAVIWITGHTTAASVRAQMALDSLSTPPEMKENTLSRYPLRIAGTIVGALTALVSGLVGSGLFTAEQGNTTTGVITAVVTLLAAFGVVVSTENKVTPLVDPRDEQGNPLVPTPRIPSRGELTRDV